MPLTKNMANLRKRFWDKVDRGNPDECWEWTASTNIHGYGQIWVEDLGRQQTASRVSYQLEYGDVPEDKVVCHTCDNPPCVNPNHLFVGSYSENFQDVSDKGNYPDRRGTNSKDAGLTEQEVKEIRNDNKRTYREMAKDYDTNMCTIGEIVRGESYQNV